MITMLKEILPYEYNKESFKMYLSYLIKTNPYTKSLLLRGMPEDMKQAKFQVIMDDFSHILAGSIKGMPGIVTLFNNDIYLRHKSELSTEVQSIFDLAINKLSLDDKIAFYNGNNINSRRNPLIFKPDKW